MKRTKIEKWIVSKDHSKHSNLIFGLTVTCVCIIVVAVFSYIKLSL